MALRFGEVLIESFLASQRFYLSLRSLTCSTCLRLVLRLAQLVGTIVPGSCCQGVMQKCYFLLYTPLESQIRPGHSVRKRFCLICFVGIFCRVRPIVGNIVPTCVGSKVTEKCNFSYILHWIWDFQRRVVLESDFVRFCFLDKMWTKLSFGLFRS